MKTKILVLGSTGMLGHMVIKVFSKEKTFEAHGTHLSNQEDLFYLDVEKGLEKLDLICKKKNGYSYFINCIGLTKNKIDEKNLSSVLRAIKINSIFPQQLAEYARKKDIRVIHISTDGVFSGEAKSYDEEALSDCTDVYGKTKSLGEVFDNHFLNIRCSIVGPSPFEKGGLWEWFISQPEGSTVFGYTNHFWNGVTTLQFAQLCSKIIKTKQFDSLRKKSYIFHFVPNQVVSKYQLLCFLKEVLRKKIKIVPKKHSSGIVKRILISKYGGMNPMYSGKMSIKKAILELKNF